MDIAGSELLWGTVLLGQRHHPASLFRHQQMRDPVPVPVALKMTMCNIDFIFILFFKCRKQAAGRNEEQAPGIFWFA